MKSATKNVTSRGLLVLLLSGCAGASAASPPPTSATASAPGSAPRQCEEELAFGGGPTDPNSNEVRQGGDPTTATPVRVGCR